MADQFANEEQDLEAMNSDEQFRQAIRNFAGMDVEQLNPQQPADEEQDQLL
ncbi:hypothetical protein [Paenibacillus thalictri]|uniref:hypothetical protein n=1 Tax=Paenibacillus thalictri TaxID=2527873 RepID=UPI0013EF3F56|nr:hypothetical protein [Paenibacillus thalictri]